MPQTRLYTSEIVDGLIRAALAVMAMVAASAVVAILAFLAYFAWPLISQGQVGHLLAWRWRPFQGEFGILPMVAGSVCLATSALLVAYPLGVGLCGFIFTQRHQPWGRLALLVVLLMTGVPTVVYGFVGVVLLVPRLRLLGAGGTGYCWLGASLILTLLILPTIVLLLWAQLEQMAPEVRLAAMALGFTPYEELLWVHLPHFRGGLAAAAVLGFGRAMGDTLVALMMAGNASQVPHSLMDAIRTLTSHIALVVATDTHSLAYQSIFAAGLLLLAQAAVVNWAWRRLKAPIR